MIVTGLFAPSDARIKEKCVQPPLDLGGQRKDARIVAASALNADDIVHFARTRLGFEPDEKQSEFLRSTAKRIVVNCCRQWGKSMISAAKVVHRVYTQPGSQVVVAARGIRQANEWMNYARNMLRKLNVPTRLDPANRISLVLPNGSRIVGIPHSPDDIRGFSALSMLVIDEAAFVSDDLYHALLPMLATTNGDILLTSSSNGKDGFFYEACQNPEVWQLIRVTASECPRISAEFLEQQLADMGRDIFMREYFCEFLGSGASQFDRELLEAAMSESIDVFDAAALAKPPNFLSSHQAHGIYFGLDLGKKQDPTAYAIIGDYGQELYIHDVGRIALGTPYTDVAKITRTMVRSPLLAKRVALIADATGVGEAVIDILRRSDLGCGITPVMITGGVGTKDTRSNGYTYVAKQQLMTRLQILLEQGRLKIARRMRHANELMKELLDFRMDGTGKGHDDLVMAVALACWKAGRGFNDRGSGGFFS